MKNNRFKRKNIFLRNKFDNKIRLNEHIDLALQSSQIEMWRLDLITEKMTFTAPSKIFADIPKNKLIYNLKDVLSIIHIEDREKFIKKINITKKTGVDFGCIYRVVLHDKNIMWISSYGKMVQDSNCDNKIIMGISQDITEHKIFQERERNIKKILSAIRNVNELITKENDEQSLIDKICSNLASILGYLNCWITLFDDNMNVIKISSSNTSKEFDALCESLKKNKFPCCVKKTLDSQKIEIINNAALECGDCPMAMRLPNYLRVSSVLKYDEKIYGLLTITVNNDFSFKIEEKELFEEIIENISFALYNLDLNKIRKDAETKLRESEEYFRALVEKMPGALFIQTRGEFRYLNKSALELFGAVNANQILGKKVIDFFHPDYREIVLQRIKTLNENFQNVPTLEEKIMKVDGTYIDAEFSAIPFNYQGSNGALVFAQNITERKLADEKIAAEKERLAVTLRCMGEGVITTDISGNIVIMNKVAEELTGWTQKECKNVPLLSIFKVFNQKNRLPIVNIISQIISTGDIINIPNDMILISKSGKEILISGSGAPIKNSASETIGTVIVISDITEKRKFLDQIIRTDKLNSLGVMAGGIAHDFNNLLSGLFGYLDMARESSEPESKTMKFLDKSISVYGRARDLTQQLLTFSKGGAPVKKTGKIENVIKENVSFILSGSNVVCQYDIIENLWLCDFDTNQISQVIDNIIINAKQAMISGGKIIISADNFVTNTKNNYELKPGYYVHISISDNGPGIPSEFINRIFDPFFTTKPKGNGLGLATCYSILQKHDGYIDVNSEVGKGSTFHIYLPASQQNELKIDIENIQIHNGNGQILIMDDEEFIIELTSEMLKNMGYEVLTAKNGKEVGIICEKLFKSNQKIDAAILDLTIPGGIGGKDAVNIISKYFPDIPVLASSGYSEDPIISNPELYGFTDSLRKPYRKKELIEIFNKHMKLKS